MDRLLLILVVVTVVYRNRRPATRTQRPALPRNVAAASIFGHNSLWQRERSSPLGKMDVRRRGRTGSATPQERGEREKGTFI